SGSGAGTAVGAAGAGGTGAGGGGAGGIRGGSAGAAALAGGGGACAGGACAAAVLAESRTPAARPCRSRGRAKKRDFVRIGVAIVFPRDRVKVRQVARAR